MPESIWLLVEEGAALLIPQPSGGFIGAIVKESAKLPVIVATSERFELLTGKDMQPSGVFLWRYDPHVEPA